MLNFRRSGRERSRASDEPPPESLVTCPFLARTIAASNTHLCLSGEEPIAISRRYVDSYCVTSDHTRCSLFVAAYRASQELHPSGTVAVTPTDEAEGIAPATSEPEMEAETEPATATSALPAAAAPADVDDTAPLEAASTPHDTEPSAPPTPMPLDTREQVLAASLSLSATVASLQAQVEQRGAAVAALRRALAEIDQQTEPATTDPDAVDDDACAAALASVQRVAEHPDNLAGYMHVGQNAPVLLAMVRGLMTALDRSSNESGAD